MNSAKDALDRASQLQQEPANVYQRRKYSTSDEAHAILIKTAQRTGLTISVVLQTLILQLAELEPDARQIEMDIGKEQGK